MNNEIFQNIFDLLQRYFPCEWKKVVFFAGYMSGSYSMKFYTMGADEKYVDCFSLEGANKAMLIKSFMDIDKLLALERKAWKTNDVWSVMTLIVGADGAMKVEFDYTDISENAIAYEQEWKQKYLN